MIIDKPDKKCNWKHPVFLEVYERDEGKSFISGKSIPFPTPVNFAHILAKGKGKYYKFMYYNKNIVLLTAEEHHLFDNGTKEQRDKYEKRSPGAFKRIYDLRIELLDEYYSEQMEEIFKDW